MAKKTEKEGLSLGQIIVAIICLALGILIIYSIAKNKGDKRIADLLNLYCEGAPKLFEHYNLLEEYDYDDVCHCVLRDGNEIEENVLYSIGGAGKNNQDYYLRLNGRFYWVRKEMIEKDDDNIRLVLHSLADYRGSGSGNRWFHLLIVDGRRPNVVITGIGSYIAVFKNSSLENEIETLTEMHRDLMIQTRFIIGK